MRCKRFCLLTSAICLLAVAPAPAAESALAGLAQYEGPDREQRLVEGARREGRLVLYTSLTVDDMTVLNAARERRVKAAMRREPGRSSARGR
jgi:iron(III) transport system substrate-binding protein